MRSSGTIDGLVSLSGIIIIARKNIPILKNPVNMHQL